MTTDKFSVRSHPRFAPNIYIAVVKPGSDDRSHDESGWFVTPDEARDLAARISAAAGMDTSG